MPDFRFEIPFKPDLTIFCHAPPSPPPFDSGLTFGIHAPIGQNRHAPPHNPAGFCVSGRYLLERFLPRLAASSPGRPFSSPTLIKRREIELHSKDFKMARGGARQGAGRKKGTTNERVKRLRSAMRVMAMKIGGIIPDAFEGDGHALMVAIYKDPRLPLDMRLDAASKAARYEKPQLQAVEHTGKDGGPIMTGNVTDAERVLALAAFMAKNGGAK